MRPHGSPEKLEARRRKAVSFLKAGYGISEVARRVGAAKGSVSRWWSAYRKKGWRELKPRQAPGRPLKLSQRQRRELTDLLSRGHFWTTQRISDLIHKSFGVRYHRDSIGPLMRTLGWAWRGANWLK